MEQRSFAAGAIASHATRGVSRACVFGQTKNTARTRQAVQFVGRGDARRKERQSRDGTAIVRRRRDRVTRNPRRQPRLRVRANKKTRPVQDKPCNLLAGETRGVRSGKAATEQRSLQNDNRKAGRKRWYFFAWTFADRVTRNTRRQPRLRVRTNKKTRLHTKAVFTDWQGRRDSNTQPTVLETATLPLSHSPKRLSLYNKNFVKSNRFYRFGGEKGVLL